MKTLLVLIMLGCGLVPLEPLAPLGCKSMKPVCICDSKGKHCYWQFVCVADD